MHRCESSAKDQGLLRSELSSIDKNKITFQVTFQVLENVWMLKPGSPTQGSAVVVVGVNTGERG